MNNNNINLLTEINRINSLMGVEKKLILEQPVPVNLIDDLFELGIKSGTDGANNALVRAIRSNTELLDNIKRIDATNKTLIEKMDEVIATTIRLGDNKLADDIIDAYITNNERIFNTWLGMIDDAIAEVEELVSKGKSPDKAISDVSKQYGDAFKNSETIPNEFFDRFIRDFESELKNLDITPPVRNVRRTVDNPTGVSVSEVKTEIESWGKWDDIPDYTLKEIDELLQFNGFSRWIKNIFIPQERVLLNKIKRFNNLSKAYAASEKKGVSVDVQARIENEMIKELQSITETSLKYRQQAEIWIKNTVDGFEKTPKGKIINPSERRFADWSKKVTNAEGKLKNPSEIRKINIKEKVSSDLAVGFKEAFSQWIKWGEPLKNKVMGIFSKTPPAPSTIKTAGPKNWFIRGSRRGNPWRKWNRKNWDDVIDRAGLSAAKRQYLYELLFRYFQWNIIWGLGETFFQSINAAAASEDTRNKIQGCIDARALPKSDTTRPEKIKQYCESIKTMKEIQLLHYWEDPLTVVFIKNTIYDWEDKDDGLIDTFTDLFPGKLDDVIIDGVIPYFRGTRDAKTIQQWQDMWSEGVETAGENLDEAQDEVQQTLESEGIEVPESQTGSSETPNTLEHAKSNLGSDATQDGEYYISSGLKFKWNPTTNTYDWVE